MKMKNYWLMKSEPNEWSWKDQVEEGISMWDGVRNYQARNNLHFLFLSFSDKKDPSS